VRNQETRSEAVASGKPVHAGTQYRVMVVDDSAVIRGYIVRALESDGEINVVESACNGEQALGAIARTPVDVVVLDIEMPVMDGMTALPMLLKARPSAKVIMVSTLTRQNAAISLQALAKGAADYIPKPTSTRELHGSEIFQRDLISKVKALAGRARRPASDSPAGPSVQKRPLYDDRKVVLRKPSLFQPSVVAIGSSTGGPQALFTVFEKLNSSLRLPVFITQHMPPTVTTILAEHIHRVGGVACIEACDKMRPEPGHVYLAPGDFHMIIEREGKQPIIRINQEPPENFCRPAVDPMLRSLAATYGPNVLGVILTGMGHDGRDGSRAVVEAGGTIIAQDEPTSVVWGMPGAVATAGLCSATLPIDSIAPRILKLVGEGKQ
jgi:two-component system chemotaxis response regulator CheB